MGTFGKDQFLTREIINDLINSLSEDELNSIIFSLDKELLAEVLKNTLQLLLFERKNK